MKNTREEWDDELEQEWTSMSEIDFERAFAMFDKKEIDIKELHPGGGKAVQLTHRPTGVRVVKKCGAVSEECYREAFRELIVQTRVFLRHRRQQKG